MIAKAGNGENKKKQNARKKRNPVPAALDGLSDAGIVVPCLLRCRRLTLPSSRASLNSMARNWLIKGEANTLLGYMVPLALPLCMVQQPCSPRDYGTCPNAMPAATIAACTCMLRARLQLQACRERKDLAGTS